MKHFHKKYWIFGSASSFQIHCLKKKFLGRWVIFGQVISISPLKLTWGSCWLAHRVHSRLTKRYWNSLDFNLNSKGKIKEQDFRFHIPSWTISLTNKSSASLIKGPAIKLLRSPSESYLSCQKFNVLLEPMWHLVPLTKISSPFLIPDQVRENAFLEFAYLLRSILAQVWSFSTCNFQLSLASKAKFFGLAADKPNPFWSSNIFPTY